MRRAPTNILAACLLFAVAGIALMVVPTVASARARDNPNYGFCKDGKQVRDIANCPENKSNSKAKAKK
jgi:hypothetical protein